MPYDNLSDEELLVQACTESSESVAREAASALLQRYHVRVFRWCCAQLGDQDLAHDVSQEVLLKAYRGLASFGGRALFSSWLFAITRNRCLDELRRNQPQIAVEAVEALIDPAADPLAICEEHSARAEIEGLLQAHLEPDEQTVMVLRYFEGMPVVEITRTLGITASSGARGVLQRARRKLRAVLRSEEDRT